MPPGKLIDGRGQLLPEVLFYLYLDENIYYILFFFKCLTFLKKAGVNIINNSPSLVAPKGWFTA